MNKALHFKKILHIFLGTILVTFGVLGLVLPILHGTIPLIIGLILLSFESNWLEKNLLILVSKNRHLKKWHGLLEYKVKGFFNIEEYKKRKDGN